MPAMDVDDKQKTFSIITNKSGTANSLILVQVFGTRLATLKQMFTHKPMIFKKKRSNTPK